MLQIDSAGQILQKFVEVRRNCNKVKGMVFLLTAVYNTHYDRAHIADIQGRRHGFESGGDNFASGASQKIFFDPPTFWPVGGTKYCLDS